MTALTDVEVRKEMDDGLRYRAMFTLLGRSVESDGRFRIVEPMAHVVSELRGDDIDGDLHYRFSETDDGGTAVRFDAEMAAGDSLVDRAMAPVVRRYMDRQFANALRTTKELIEAERQPLAEVTA